MTMLNILLLLAFVVVMFMMMKKGGGCCGGGHSHGGHAHGEDDQAPNDQQNTLESGDSKTGTDPVCGMTVDKEGGLSSQHLGKIYTFCSENCRKTFESNPEKFVS